MFRLSTRAPVDEPWAIAISTRRLIRAAAVFALSLAPCSIASAAALDAAPGAAAAEVTVSIENFTFAPDVLTIAPGTTVTWVNHDDIPHQVAERNLDFRSKPLDTDDAFSMRFDGPGEVDYFCTLHPHMTGRIIVAVPQ